MSFKIKYKLYKFLFLVSMNQEKVEKILNLAATNSKKSVDIIHENFFFSEFYNPNLEVDVMHK